MFESTNRMRFVVDIGEQDMEWWLGSIYVPFGLTPEEVGDRLSVSWAGDKLMEITELNGHLRRFAVSISGELGTG
jgi:hypothetical protein